jgi:putative membrane protein
MYRALTLAIAIAIALTARVSRADDDAEFMKKAASGGHMEVELGEYAAENASSSDVKEFGRRMVQDHGKANRELKALAARKNVELPETMSGEHGETAQELMKLRGAEFDKAYMREMVSDHEKDVAKFREQAQSGTSELDEWAGKTLATLQSHLEEAKRIHGRLEGGAMGSGSGHGSGVDTPPASGVGPTGTMPDEPPRKTTP